MAIVGKAFRKCLPEDKNSCVNCDNYLTCPLAEELQREYCPDSNKVADAMKQWNFYKPGCSDSYAAYMEMVGNTVGGNIVSRNRSGVDLVQNRLHKQLYSHQSGN